MNYNNLIINNIYINGAGQHKTPSAPEVQAAEGV
jgi:hypothetical protein